jgi:hypothetical protein
MNCQSTVTENDLLDEKHALLCDYLAQPFVHAILTEKLWRDEIKALEKELVGATRVRPNLEIISATKTTTRIRRTEDHYLDESPRFIQVETKRRCAPTMDALATAARVDLYMRGGLVFGYRSLVTHLERPHDAGPPSWNGTVAVFEPEPEAVQVDARLDFQVGVFVLTREVSLAHIAEQARVFRRRAPKIRLVIVWAVTPHWMPEEFSETSGLPLVAPGALFDDFCERRRSGAAPKG